MTAAYVLAGELPKQEDGTMRLYRNEKLLRCSSAGKQKGAERFPRPSLRAPDGA